jgi:hypothetical protein
LEELGEWLFLLLVVEGQLLLMLCRLNRELGVLMQLLVLDTCGFFLAPLEVEQVLALAPLEVLLGLLIQLLLFGKAGLVVVKLLFVLAGGDRLVHLDWGSVVPQGCLISMWR